MSAAAEIDCARCGARVPLDFAIAADGRSIEVRCAACAATFAIAARPAAILAPAVPAPAIPAPPAGEMRCPKCDTAQPPAAACRACGLAAERMAAFAQAERDADRPPELIAAWQRATLVWDDARAHERVIELAATTASYAWVARQYRAAGRDRPDDPMVASQLARLARMTEATLRATSDLRARGGSPATPYRNTVVILLILVAAMGAGLVWAMTARGGEEPAPVETQARPPLRTP
ncbi:MAG: hypothetical protein K8W52_37685 [Deltaproteobacteria bacterium]|nr:hypothetical protein [Deltaproteobacteria bacterium]